MTTKSDERMMLSLLNLSLMALLAGAVIYQSFQVSELTSENRIYQTFLAGLTDCSYSYPMIHDFKACVNGVNFAVQKMDGGGD